MSLRRILVLAGIVALAACGRQAELEPAPGHALPVKPEMARATPSVGELLAPPTDARPDRVDELVTKSRPRPDDPFDLPPPTGGNAPPLPAGTAPGPVIDNTTSANPGE
jgi:hypothetical protein